MKNLAILFLFMSLAFASCQTKYPDLEKGVYAEFVTNKGTFVAKLYNEEAPLTVANFVSLSEGTNDMVDSIYKGKPFYNGLTYMNEDVNLKSYSLLDFYISQNILDNKMKLFANVTNIFNEDYQELYQLFLLHLY